LELHGELDERALERLWVHYQELARWNERISLIGPGTVEEILSRHYGESLLALQLLDEKDRSLVDIGSGGGFPGFVLAAARPDLDVTLVESRQRKWSFLSVVCQKAALPCHCLNVRVAAVLPEPFPRLVDVVASRAVHLKKAEIKALSGCLSPRGRFLLWAGAGDAGETGDLTSKRSLSVKGADYRRIVELTPNDSKAAH
jgi:16S rRNA (guanine527-N7)-methyltransferase